MIVRIGDRHGFAAGLLFLAIGAGAAAVVSGYRMGTALHMGPGYYPLAVALLLSVAGIAAMLRALVIVGGSANTLAIRPAVLITASVLAFGAAIDRIGLVPATLLAVLIASLSARPFRVVQTGLLAVVLAVFAAGIFIYGLHLPFTLFG